MRKMKIVGGMLLLFFIGISSIASEKIDLKQYQNEKFNVKVINDLKYGEAINFKGQKDDLVLDLYLPEEDIEKNRPLIVFVHGGGFRTDSSKMQKYVVRFAENFAKRGFVAASIEYRRRTKQAMPTKRDELPALKDVVEDLNTSLAWLRKKSEEYGYNTDYIYLAGGSAGGRTVTSMGLYDNDNLEYPVKLDKTGIIAIANLWGSPEPEMRWYKVDSKDIPMVIIHGTADQTIDVQNSIDLHKELVAAGVPVAFHPMKNQKHTPTGGKNDIKIMDWVTEFFIEQTEVKNKNKK